MNFDDYYMLKLYIKISDYENAYKYYKKVRTSKIDSSEIRESLSLYCNDLHVFKLFEKDKAIFSSEFILNLMKNPFDNFDIIKEYTENNKEHKSNLSQFYSPDKSVILSLMKNLNSKKKIKTYEYLLNKGDFDLNVKNENGQTNSQVMINENPTDIDSVYVEKMEKVTKSKNEGNKFLFRSYKDGVGFSMSNKKVFTSKVDNLLGEINNFIREPEESYKINFSDIEYNLLLLNLKLRRMSEFDINSLKKLEDYGYSSHTKIHSSVMNNFLFEKLLLDKI